jgi:Zn-dependent protease with chaperone function
MALLGIWLIIKLWPSPFAIVIGVVLLGLAWMQRPRMASPPDDGLRRGEFPKFFGLIDDVAHSIGIPPIEFVRLDYQFNASLTEVTWKRLPVLTIGFPLWKILAPQARIALIAHELAHRANGDPARATVPAVAIDILDEWAALLREDSSKLAGEFYAIFVKAGMGMLLAIVVVVRRCIFQLLYLDRQRAEYFADFLAARVAGTSAAMTCLASCVLPTASALSSYRG